jgi:hypothetical protein
MVFLKAQGAYVLSFISLLGTTGDIRLPLLFHGCLSRIPYAKVESHVFTCPVATGCHTCHVLGISLSVMTRCVYLVYRISLQVLLSNIPLVLRNVVLFGIGDAFQPQSRSDIWIYSGCLSLETRDKNGKENQKLKLILESYLRIPYEY